MPIKTYVLLESTMPSAPIYNVINKKRHAINQIPKWRPFLQYTFMSEDNKNTTIRFKLNSNTIYLDKQVKEENIPANEKFTTRERDTLKFVNGALVIRNPVAQEFLESNPHFDNFKGFADELVRPFYKVYDKEKEVNEQYSLFQKTVKAAVSIEKMDLKAVQKLLISINGIGYVPSGDIKEAKNSLVNYMDNSEEAVDEILNNMPSERDFNIMLVGSLVAAGVLSFEALPNEVALKKDNGWSSVKSISSSEYSLDQRQELFVDHLSTSAGAELREVLQAIEEEL
jgi:hypothetical protein